METISGIAEKVARITIKGSFLTCYHLVRFAGLRSGKASQNRDEDGERSNANGLSAAVVVSSEILSGLAST